MIISKSETRVSFVAGWCNYCVVEFVSLLQSKLLAVLSKGNLTIVCSFRKVQNFCLLIRGSKLYISWFLKLIYGVLSWSSGILWLFKQPLNYMAIDWVYGDREIEEGSGWKLHPLELSNIPPYTFLLSPWSTKHICFWLWHIGVF